jgi:hypothetical protein
VCIALSANVTFFVPDYDILQPTKLVLLKSLSVNLIWVKPNHSWQRAYKVGKCFKTVRFAVQYGWDSGFTYQHEIKKYQKAYISYGMLHFMYISTSSLTIYFMHPSAVPSTSGMLPNASPIRKYQEKQLLLLLHIFLTLSITSITFKTLIPYWTNPYTPIVQSRWGSRHGGWWIRDYVTPTEMHQYTRTCTLMLTLYSSELPLGLIEHYYQETVHNKFVFGSKWV